jgi:hypothetical protein
MTKVFDDNARKKYIEDMSKDIEVYVDGKVKDMIVERVEAKFARPYIAFHHYTKTFPDSTKYTFAGYINGKLAGIITYGMGVGLNQYTALLPDLEKGEYLELTRLWSPDGFPKNTETKLISQSMKLLPKEVRLVMSFADGSRGHVGTIYQASNFYYCGMSNGGKMLITEDGIEKHPRLLGIYRMRHPKKYGDLKNKELMEILGYTYIKNAKKYRYAIPTSSDKTQRKKDMELLKEKSLEYPRKEENNV